MKYSILTFCIFLSACLHDEESDNSITVDNTGVCEEVDFDFSGCWVSNFCSPSTRLIEGEVVIDFWRKSQFMFTSEGLLEQISYSYFNEQCTGDTLKIETFTPSSNQLYFIANGKITLNDGVSADHLSISLGSRTATNAFDVAVIATQDDRLCMSNNFQVRSGSVSLSYEENLNNLVIDYESCLERGKLP